MRMSSRRSGNRFGRLTENFANGINDKEKLSNEWLGRWKMLMKIFFMTCKPSILFFRPHTAMKKTWNRTPWWGWHFPYIYFMPFHYWLFVMMCLFCLLCDIFYVTFILTPLVLKHLRPLPGDFFLFDTNNMKESKKIF